MMAGGFDGLAETWSTRSIFLFFLPVGEALSHPRVGQGGEKGAGGLGLGRDGLVGVWGAAHHGPAHTGG